MALGARPPAVERVDVDGPRLVRAEVVARVHDRGGETGGHGALDVVAEREVRVLGVVDERRAVHVGVPGRRPRHEVRHRVVDDQRVVADGAVDRGLEGELAEEPDVGPQRGGVVVRVRAPQPRARGAR